MGTADDADSARRSSRATSSRAPLFAALIAFLIGIVCVTAEWRHGTITRTFLVTPRRGRVLVAKEIWIVVLAAFVALLALVLVLAIALPWLELEGSSFDLGDGLAGYAGRIVLATMLWGALGVGIGAVVQSQTPPSSARSSGSSSSRR